MDLAGETRVMGILNVTPDSFSDGGAHATAGTAVDAALRMEADGADLIDVGGESTRPGASPVGLADELARVLPVIEGIKKRSNARVSIDTMKSEVARRALAAGADLVNDVTGLADPAMIEVVREARVPVIVMHMRGDPRTMQRDVHYADVVREVSDFLRAAVAKAVEAGIDGGKILVDPGLGFGKSYTGNLRILRELPALASVGRPLVIGASRKSFVGTALDLPVSDRLEGSLAVAAYAAWNGASVIRAHDVRATKRVTRMIDALMGG